MCVFDISNDEVLDQDLVAYKVVVKSFSENGEYISRFDPFLRRKQHKQREQFNPLIDEGTADDFYSEKLGTVKSYSLNKETFSSFEDTPGLYCYTAIQKAAKSRTLVRWGAVILEVRIPAGTKIRRASSSFDGDLDKEIVLTEALVPMKEVSNWKEIKVSLDDVNSDGEPFTKK